MATSWVPPTAPPTWASTIATPAVPIFQPVVVGQPVAVAVAPQPVVAAAAPATAVQPATPVSTSATAPVPVANAPVPKKRQAKPQLTRGELYLQAREKTAYFKAAGDDNLLKLTGASSHLTKNPTSIYHGVLRAFGTLEAIQALLTDQAFVATLVTAGVDLNQINDPVWVLNQASLAALKTQPESWVSQELALVKQRQVKTPVSLDAVHDRAKSWMDAFKVAKPVKLAAKSDPVTLMRERMDEMAAKGWVVDVTTFNVKTGKGAKNAKRPAVNGRSQRSALISLPVAATTREAIAGFLNYLGYSLADIQQLLLEWQPPTIVAIAPAAATVVA